MEAEGLNEADVISKALSILETVWRTDRVALVKQVNQSAVRTAATEIDYYFKIFPTYNDKQEGMQTQVSSPQLQLLHQKRLKIQVTTATISPLKRQ